MGYSDLPDLAGLNDRRFSRRNIRLMASELLPFNSERCFKISLRAASSLADFVLLVAIFRCWFSIGTIERYSVCSAAFNISAGTCVCLDHDLGGRTPGRG